jgi:hypothetical protein
MCRRQAQFGDNRVFSMMKVQYLNLEVAERCQASGKHRTHGFFAGDVAAESVTGITHPTRSECSQDCGNITVFLCGEVTLHDLFAYRS